MSGDLRKTHLLFLKHSNKKIWRLSFICAEICCTSCSLEFLLDKNSMRRCILKFTHLSNFECEKSMWPLSGENLRKSAKRDQKGRCDDAKAYVGRLTSDLPLQRSLCCRCELIYGYRLRAQYYTKNYIPWYGAYMVYMV